VLIQPDRQRVDLPLQLGQATGQAVALLAEGLGQRDDRIDEPAFTFVGGRDLAHCSALRREGADQTAIRVPRRDAPTACPWRVGVSAA
jgi:hypothetical protein